MPSHHRPRKQPTKAAETAIDKFARIRGAALNSLNEWFDLVDSLRLGSKPIDRAAALRAAELEHR